MANLSDIADPRLAAQAAQLRSRFEHAQPFRHLCIDRFLTPSVAAQALEDFPCFKTENAINEFGVVGGKAVETKLGSISPCYKDLYDWFMSRPFLDLMSDITGIPALMADPNLFGGGAHENRDGQELDPHVDFNRMEDLSAYRRLNLLIYLNPEWNAEWGGSIELHSDPRRPEINRIRPFEPLFNRAVLFETSEVSWHGFPRIRLPENKKHLSRKSVSVYLYTRTRPAEEIVGPHATFYVQRPMQEFLVSGYTLTPGDVTEIKEAMARRDAWIEHYQNKEVELSDQVQTGRTFIQEVLASLWAPITGFGVQQGRLIGMYHDRWVGPHLALTVQPKRAVTGVTVRGWVPDDMPVGGRLDLRVAEQVVAGDLVPGPFALTVTLPEATEAPIPIEVDASQSVRPEGPGGRVLTFVLQEIALTHALSAAVLAAAQSSSN
jgi:hypothetical protein